MVAHELRKAHKTHECTLCGLPINPGQAYFYRRMAPWDHEVNSRFFSYKAHEHCHEFFEAYTDDGLFPCDADAQQEFREAMADE